MKLAPPRAFQFGYINTITGERSAPQYKQAIAHASEADILFYGGAVGGGKTEFIVVEFVTQALEHPRGQFAIFRRTRKELDESVVIRLRELVPESIGKYNKQDAVLTLYNGAQLWLGYADSDADVYRYQSAQWDGLGIDECSHMNEFKVTYLIGRVRRTRRGGRRKIRLGSNPGGVGHGWLKRWFIRPVPRELGPHRAAPRPYAIWQPLPLTDKVKPEDVYTRQFIPALFQDNPALRELNPNYLASIYALGGDKARQLAEGDWDANESMIVGGLWRDHHVITPDDKTLIARGLKVGALIPWHIIPKRWRPPVGAKLFGSIDYGFGAPWSFHLHATLPGGHCRTFFEFYKPRVRDEEQARLIRAVLERETHADGKTPLMDGLEWMVYDPQMKGSREEMGLSKSIIEVYGDTMPRVQFQAGAGGRSARLSRPNRWLDALSTQDDGLPYWSVTTDCPDLIRTVPEVPWDEDDPDVEDDDSENHAYEDVGRFFEARPAPTRTAVPDPLDELDPLSAAHQRMLQKRYDEAGGRKGIHFAG